MNVKIIGMKLKTILVKITGIRSKIDERVFLKNLFTLCLKVNTVGELKHRVKHSTPTAMKTWR